MKRTEALKPLSREHHHALFVAKVVRDQEGGGDSVDRLLEFWNEEGEIHFRVEEEVLLPGSGLPGPDRDEEVARMLTEHLEIRRGVAAVKDGGTDPADVLALAERMHGHVRFEERELFPRIEREMAPEALERLAAEIEAAER